MTIFEFPSRGVTAQLRPLIAAPRAADAMVLIDLDDLAAHAAGDLARLALLVGGGLVECRDP
jgi:hypothetical protein